MKNVIFFLCLLLCSFVCSYSQNESSTSNNVWERTPSDRTRYDSEYSEQATYLHIQNYRLSCQLIQILRQKNWIVVTAESVSAGNLAATLARAPGSGDVLAGGAVCYKIEAKKQLLGVPDQKEQDLYDLQTATDMALGAQKLYRVSPANQVGDVETYHQKNVMAIATTGRAVTYKDRWEGGVYIAIAFPDGKVHSVYSPHTFTNSLGQPDCARTKEEGMLVAVHKALLYALAQMSLSEK